MRLILLALTVLVVSTSARAGGFSSWEFAQHVQDRVWSELQDCGLTRMSATDPRLPRPRVPADDAVVNKHGRLLAYSYFYNYGQVRFEFKNPNGGMSHEMSLYGQDIGFLTPKMGTVAWSNHTETPQGTQISYWCRSQKVFDFESFNTCVEKYYVKVISNQLCQFADSN